MHVVLSGICARREKPSPTHFEAALWKKLLHGYTHLKKTLNTASFVYGEQTKVFLHVDKNRRVMAASSSGGGSGSSELGG